LGTVGTQAAAVGVAVDAAMDDGGAGRATGDAAAVDVTLVAARDSDGGGAGAHAATTESVAIASPIIRMSLIPRRSLTGSTGPVGERRFDTTPALRHTPRHDGRPPVLLSVPGMTVSG